MTRQGWQCPLCEVVHNPETKVCGCKQEPATEPISPFSGTTLDKCFCRHNFITGKVGQRSCMLCRSELTADEAGDKP